jgi:hypothetical protein
MWLVPELLEVQAKLELLDSRASPGLPEVMVLPEPLSAWALSALLVRPARTLACSCTLLSTGLNAEIAISIVAAMSIATARALADNRVRLGSARSTASSLPSSWDGRAMATETMLDAPNERASFATSSRCAA